MGVSTAKAKKLTQIFLWKIKSSNPSPTKLFMSHPKAEVSKFIGPQNKTFKPPILRTKTGERVFA